MKAIPSYQSPDRVSNQQSSVQTAAIENLSKTPQNGGTVLTSISLTVGSNDITHKLGKKLTGWYIVRQRAAATIYDTQDTNRTPNLSLTLNSSAAVTVDIFVF